MPLCQYFTYVEIMPRRHQALWQHYEQVRQSHPDHFAMQQIINASPTSIRCSANCFEAGWHDAAAADFRRFGVELRTDRRATTRIGAGGGALRLDTYPNQIEVITSEQMMDAYASVGMPIGYHHWSFGKQFVSVEQNYKRGQMGLAYEIVINSNPCIAYLMEENTMMMQALVIAHACYGHNSFFKGNYLFRTWTDAGSIIDYLVFAKNYIASARSATASTRSSGCSTPATP
jgi:hypothetical protein